MNVPSMRASFTRPVPGESAGSQNSAALPPSFADTSQPSAPGPGAMNRLVPVNRIRSPSRSAVTAAPVGSSWPSRSCHASAAIVRPPVTS